VSRLELYAQGWREAAADVRAVTAGLSDEEWQAPTGCPGWSVADVLAHLVAIEEQLVGLNATELEAARGEREVTPAWTATGVDERRGKSPTELVADLDAALGVRQAQLEQQLPDADPAGAPPHVPAGLPWSWEVLLRNRAIDMWVHSQDIRRAIGRPGGMENMGAAVTMSAFTAALPYVLGKKVRPPVGTSVVWEVSGAHRATTAVGVDDSRRAVHLGEAPAEPTCRLTMDSETFAALAAGRIDPSTASVTVTGDAELGARVLAAMAITP
jgi:uncharacterized protein (TIGR03083 family)